MSKNLNKKGITISVVGGGAQMGKASFINELMKSNMSITREEALNIINKLKPILENRIEYIDNLQEIECMSKDSREWKEAKDVLKLISFINQQTTPIKDTVVEEALEMMDSCFEGTNFLQKEYVSNTIKQALQDKDNEIETLRGALNVFSKNDNLFGTSNYKLKNRLNAIMQVLYNDTTVSGEVEYKCEQIIKGGNNEE